jgi:hypothetical protein
VLPHVLNRFEAVVDQDGCHLVGMQERQPGLAALVADALQTHQGHELSERVPTNST